MTFRFREDDSAALISAISLQPILDLHREPQTIILENWLLNRAVADKLFYADS
jgi:hypothetical protein